MEAYIYNTANRKRYNIQYLDFTIDGGGASATYQSADVPLATNQYLYWAKTIPSQRSLEITMAGQNTLKDIDLLKSFAYPHKKGFSPPALKVKIGNLPILNLILESVGSEIELVDENTLYAFPWARRRAVNVGRDRANAQSSSINDDSISAFERFKNYLKARIGIGEEPQEEEYYERTISSPDTPEFELYRRGQFNRYIQTDLLNRTDFKFLKAKVNLTFIELRDGSNILSNR